MTPDLINGAFELFGACMAWLNVRALYRAKRFEGVHIGVTVFFTTWGFWNLYYYPALEQWASAAAGVLLAAGNATWVALALRYRGN